jgi:AraC-like DNA-binding protein
LLEYVAGVLNETVNFALAHRAETDMLAQATGTYRERPVAGPLREHFVCAWIHCLPGTETPPVVVVPDGCIDLQWIAGAWRIAGPDREAIVENLAAGTTVVGFRFRPARAAAWLGVPASELVNRRVPLEEFWGFEACRLAERANKTSNIATLVRVLETASARRRPAISARATTMHAVFELLCAGAPPGKSLIVWLSRELAMSERTLRRHCEDAFGYGPKTLDRILRFQRFLKLARNSGNASTASLALEAGYADQAHLVRESRRLSATTPRELAALLAD